MTTDSSGTFHAEDRVDGGVLIEAAEVHDLPDGDWRRVQKADGYRFMIVNGQITFEDGVCTNALPGKLLRSYDQAPA